ASNGLGPSRYDQPPAEWSRWNVSLGLAVAPAWPAEPTWRRSRSSLVHLRSCGLRLLCLRLRAVRQVGQDTMRLGKLWVSFRAKLVQQLEHSAHPLHVVPKVSLQVDPRGRAHGAPSLNSS